MNETEGFQDLLPASDAEQGVAARAVYEQRKLAAGDDTVESLSKRERMLIERAWEAGADSARKVLAKKLDSPHAVTLDAKAVQHVVAAWSDSPDLFTFDFWPRTVGVHHDPWVVRLVRGVLTELEREGSVEETPSS